MVRSRVLLVSRPSRVFLAAVSRRTVPALALSEARLKFNAGGRNPAGFYFLGEVEAAGADVDAADGEDS